VIATPSALHAQQAEAALARGMAVFCQKPLARTAEETRGVIDAARTPTGCWASTCRTGAPPACSASANCVSAGDIGEVYAVDLVFHNAYGPDKPWFRDPCFRAAAA
jgi:predicted dehydrogenase